MIVSVGYRVKSHRGIESQGCLNDNPVTNSISLQEIRHAGSYFVFT